MIDFADLSVRVNYGDIPKATRALEELVTASGKAEQATTRVGVSSVAQTRGMGAWAAIQAEAAGHVGEHSIAIGRLERALAGFVGHAFGANTAVESLFAGILKFSVGTLETVGVLAGLAAIVGLYELLTSSAREAKKQADDMTDSLVHQARAAEEATLRGRENLQLIAETNKQAVDKESGFGWRSFLLSAVTGRITLSDTDVERQATRRANAQTAVDQAAKNYADTWKKAEEERTRKLEEEQRKREALFRKEETARLAREREIGAEIAIAADAANRHRDDLTAARRLNLVPTTAIASLQPIGQLSDAEMKHLESVRRLDEEYKAAKQVFSSTTAAVQDFQEGLKTAETDFLRSISPSNLVQKVLGGITQRIDSFVSGIAHSITHALFGDNSEERAAKRAEIQAAKSVALSLDAIAAQLAHNDLQAALDQLRIGLIATLQAIDAAEPGKRNEVQRNADRQRAIDLEKQSEAQARHQDELNKRYAQEDLQVRNLRALGQGDAADRLAFKEQQQREYQAAYDKAMADGLITAAEQLDLNTLATVQNNEWLAFLNGTLQRTALNMVEGYRLQAAIFGAMTPQLPGSPFSPLSPLSPVNPTGGLSPRGDLTVNVVLPDGTVLGKVVLRDFKRTAQRQFGDTTKWSAIQ